MLILKQIIQQIMVKCELRCGCNAFVESADTRRNFERIEFMQGIHAQDCKSMSFFRANQKAW